MYKGGKVIYLYGGVLGELWLKSGKLHLESHGPVARNRSTLGLSSASLHLLGSRVLDDDHV